MEKSEVVDALRKHHRFVLHVVVCGLVPGEVHTCQCRLAAHCIVRAYRYMEAGAISIKK